MFKTRIFRRGHSHVWLAGWLTVAAAIATVRLRQGFGGQPSRLRREGWWSRSGSNRRPQACKARALPTELRPQKSVQSGLPSRSRGRKPVFAPRGSDAAAFAALQRRLVGPGRVERPTSRLSGVRSNHLSYEPEIALNRVSGSLRQDNRDDPDSSRAPSRPSDSDIDGKGRETKTAVLSPYG